MSKTDSMSHHNQTMYGLVHRRDRRLACWAMPGGDKRGPLLFRSEGDANGYCRKVAGREWKPKRLGPAVVQQAVNDYGQGSRYWEVAKHQMTLVDRVSFKELSEMVSRSVSPLRHSKLSPELEMQCRETYKSVGKYLQPTFEQWELDFLRNRNPDKELTIWKHIGDALEVWRQKHPEGNARVAVGYLSLIASGAVGDLPAAYADLADLYDGPVSPITFTERK